MIAILTLLAIFVLWRFGLNLKRRLQQRQAIQGKSFQPPPSFSYDYRRSGWHWLNFRYLYYRSYFPT